MDRAPCGLVENLNTIFVAKKIRAKTHGVSNEKQFFQGTLLCSKFFHKELRSLNIRNQIFTFYGNCSKITLSETENLRVHNTGNVKQKKKE